MSKAAFFGHRDFNYGKYADKIEEILVNLILNHGVEEFYNGFRGDFDKICAKLVSELKKTYPNIRNIMVLSYHPVKEFILPHYFDESVYLLEKEVPPKFAIWHTNRKLVELVDFVVSGVIASYGGARSACDYALRKQKTVLNLFSMPS